MSRSLEQVNVGTNTAGRIVLSFLCDCATVTNLVTDLDAENLPARRAAETQARRLGEREEPDD